MDYKQLIWFVYIVGCIIVMLYSYIIYKFKASNIYILFVISTFTIILLLSNAYFSSNDPIIAHKDEVELYSYVELNGRTLVTAALGIGVFFWILNDKLPKNKKIHSGYLLPVLQSFIFSCLILTVIWMPQTTGKHIRILRDIKTIFLISSISNLIIAMSNIVIDIT